MTSRLFLAALLLCTAAQATANDRSVPAPATGVSTLTVTVVGLEGDGQLLVGLYDSEAGFEAENDKMGRTVNVTGPEAVVRFDVPPGDYALKVFHDEDSDGKLDTTLGIPSEPYGFSNNASDPFSAPEWDETRFSVAGPVTAHRIDLD